MTWVIGSRGVWFPFIAADVRVSWGDAMHHDCLQKVQAITPNILGGFAGSVRLGLRVLETLRAEMTGRPSLKVAAHTHMKQIMRRCLRIERERGDVMRTDFLFVASHPTQLEVPQIGLPVREGARFRSSDGFDPDSTCFSRSAFVGIGNGQDHEQLAGPISDLYRGLSEKQFPGQNPDALGFVVCGHIRDTLRKQPVPAVSQWFVYGATRTDSHFLRAFECESRENGEIVQHRTPPLVSSLREFEMFAGGHGLRAEAGIA